MLIEFKLWMPWPFFITKIYIRLKEYKFNNGLNKIFLEREREEIIRYQHHSLRKRYPKISIMHFSYVEGLKEPTKTQTPWRVTMTNNVIAGGVGAIELRYNIGPYLISDLNRKKRECLNYNYRQDKVRLSSLNFFVHHLEI